MMHCPCIDWTLRSCFHWLDDAHDSNIRGPDVGTGLGFKRVYVILTCEVMLMVETWETRDVDV